MAKLEHRIKENPKLCQRELSDGRISLYLEYYLGRKQWIDPDTEKIKVKHYRKKENLGLYISAGPKTPIERNQNRETLELAKQIRYEKEQELKQDKHGYRLKKAGPVNILEYFQQYIDRYTKKDIRVMEGVLLDFISFLKSEYSGYETYLKPSQVNADMVQQFRDYLQDNHKGEGAKTYFQRFKKFIKHAVKEKIMNNNPCEDITCNVDEQALKKDILSMDEVKKLLATHYNNENHVIQKAFEFCLYTGIRYVDVKELTYRNIDYSNRWLKFDQSKTSGKSKVSTVVIPLNNNLLSIIGKPPLDNEGSPQYEAKIFLLPSHNMCLKALKRWTKRAGISKHITWHGARHSFAVNILNNGANIKTVASLLGHSGLRHTEKYTRAVDELKEIAINSLFA